MADDNNKPKKPKTQEEIHEQNRRRVRLYMGIPSMKDMETKGIKLIDTPIRKGASADSSGYFAKQWHDAKADRKLAFKWSDKEGVDFFDKKADEAKENYHRQKNKGEKGVILNYDKDGHFVGPFGGSKEAPKKEMKPAKIVAPVKRPVAAAQKKATGKK